MDQNNPTINGLQDCFTIIVNNDLSNSCEIDYSFIHYGDLYSAS